LLVWSVWVEWAVVSGDRSAPRVSRDELLAMTPQVIRETLPMVAWDIGRLRALELPVRRVAVRELAWLFDLPLWQLNGVRFQVSPGRVRDDPAGFPDHMRRVMAADLGRPVHLVEHNGRLVVLDGFHRLLKAALEGRAEIDAMVLSGEDLESVCRACGEARCSPVCGMPDV
jgi:hypothetical protein